MRRSRSIGGSVISAEELYEAAFGAGSDLRKRRSLAMQLDGRGIHQVEPGAMQANVGADLPRQQRMLVCGIIADQQDGGRVVYVAHGRGHIAFSSQRGSESREVGSAMMVDVIGSQHQARELLQQVVLFVAGAVGSDDPDGTRTTVG